MKDIFLTPSAVIAMVLVVVCIAIWGLLAVTAVFSDRLHYVRPAMLQIRSYWAGSLAKPDPQPLQYWSRIIGTFQAVGEDWRAQLLMNLQEASDVDDDALAESIARRLGDAVRETAIACTSAERRKLIRDIHHALIAYPSRVHSQ